MIPAQKLLDLLLKAGCSESESVVYLSLLQKPVKFAYELVKETGLSKSAVYRAIDGLREKKMLKEDELIQAASLKKLVADLDTSSKELRTAADGLRKLSPFLHMPTEAVEEYQHFYDTDHVAEAYLNMAERNYSTNLDFGDFESFIPTIGGITTGDRFRVARSKHANHRAICTTFGPYSAYYANSEAKEIFKTNVDRLNIDFKNQFIVFSDTGDYVLFVHSDNDDSDAVLVKSKLMADIQRSQFDIFSRKVENF